MLRTVLLDFDFTLTDSSRGIVECVHSAMRTLGLPEASPQRALETVGLTPPEVLQALTGITDPAVAAEFSRLFRDRADAVMMSRAGVYDGVEPTLNTVCTGGHSVGIVSSKRRQHIETILANRGLAHHFDALTVSPPEGGKWPVTERWDEAASVRI